MGKFSEQNQTMIQLEIMDADVNDAGIYELVAKNAEGETHSQMVELTSEQVKMSLQAQEEAEAKKKKKKKKKEEKKDLIAPEISSFLRNQILKEGENIEMKCRLEEEIEEGDVTVTWYFNEEVFTESDRVQQTFDGTFAKLFIASCTTKDQGSYKCHFKNDKGEDSTQGKVTVKPAPKAVEEEASPEPAPQDAKPKLSYAQQRAKEKEMEKKEEEPAKAEGEMFKLKKKSSVTPRKQIPKEEEEQPAFAGMKLKKAQTVKRQWDDGGLEKV